MKLFLVVLGLALVAGFALIAYGLCGLLHSDAGDWRPELNNGILRWVNGKTAEVLTADEYAKRNPVTFQTVKRGGDWC